MVRLLTSFNLGQINQWVAQSSAIGELVLCYVSLPCNIRVRFSTKPHVTMNVEQHQSDACPPDGNCPSGRYSEQQLPSPREGRGDGNSDNMKGEIGRDEKTATFNVMSTPRRSPVRSSLSSSGEW